MKAKDLLILCTIWQKRVDSRQMKLQKIIVITWTVRNFPLAVINTFYLDCHLFRSMFT